MNSRLTAYQHLVAASVPALTWDTLIAIMTSQARRIQDVDANIEFECGQLLDVVLIMFDRLLLPATHYEDEKYLPRTGGRLGKRTLSIQSDVILGLHLNSQLEGLHLDAYPYRTEFITTLCQMMHTIVFVLHQYKLTITDTFAL